MKIRIKYGKTTQGKFLSHLDLMRAWQRTLRRAGIPVAYSQGYNPHPKFSFGSALQVGATSSGEYMDIELKNELPIEEITNKIKKYLPDALEIYEIKEINLQEASLMEMINTAKYEINVDLEESVDQELVDNIIRDVLNKESITVLRKTKKGIKEKDIRKGIYNLKGKVLKGNQVLLEFTVQTGSSGNVRPDEVLKVLKQQGLPINLDYFMIHREGLYIKKENTLISPICG